jgi:hypothetical protein
MDESKVAEVLLEYEELTDHMAKTIEHMSKVLVKLSDLTAQLVSVSGSDKEENT